MEKWTMDHLGNAALAAAVFGVLGILLTLLGYKTFDWVMTRIDVQTELRDKQNVAVAIVAAAIIIAVAIVVSAAISG